MGAALSRFFNFGKDSSASTSASSADNSAAEEAKKRKEAQRLAAEERKRELAALAQEKRIAQQKAAEQRRKVIEEKRAIAQAQAEARKKDIEEKKRVAAAAKVKQAEKVIKSSDLINSKPSRTISLFGFGQKQDTTATTTTTTTTKTKAPPPRGVPIIKGWKQNKDGSITGFISGSPNYDDGEIVTTSKLKTSGVIEGGSIVQTISGSRYYLDPKVPKSNIGLFSRTKKTSTATTNTIKKKKESKTIPVSLTTSLFSTKSVVPPKGIPKFVNWKKNKDNSIT